MQGVSIIKKGYVGNTEGIPILSQGLCATSCVTIFALQWL